MIPLRDNNLHAKTPVVTIALIAVNIAVFLYQLSLGGHLEEFINTFGFIPYRLHIGGSLFFKIIPFFSSMFLHAGIWHLLGNCLYLWIFGDNVEDRLGSFRFLAFYLLCGIAASSIHAAVNINSTVPAIGASGAIAGVLGAYFLLFPKARVLTLLPLFIFWQIIEVPAFFFLGFWFFYQCLLGISSLGIRDATGIAFWAHIGGFGAGILLLKIFLKEKNKYYSV